MARSERQIPRAHHKRRSEAAVGGDREGMKRPDLGRGHDLSRIENIVRIERAFQRIAFRSSTHKRGFPCDANVRICNQCQNMKWMSDHNNRTPATATAS
jgi:hypothetical protein